MIKFTWKMWNRLNRKKNWISGFSDFYFSSFGHFWSFLYLNFRWIFHNNSKNKKSENFFIIFPIIYNTLPIIHKTLIKSEGKGVCMSVIGTQPSFLEPSWTSECNINSLPKIVILGAKNLICCMREYEIIVIRGGKEDDTYIVRDYGTLS